MGSPLKAFIACLTIAGLFINPIKAQRINSLLVKADSLLDQGNYTTAEQNYQQALATSGLHGESDTLGIIYLRLGIMYERRSLYSKALQYYFESRKVFEKIGAAGNTAAVKQNIGNIYRTLGKPQLAFSYVNSAYLEYIKLKDSSNLPYALNDLGNLCMDQDSTEKALFFFRSILEGYKHHATEMLKATAISNMASIYVMDGKYARALAYYQRAYQYRKALGDKYKMAFILCNMANLYDTMHNYEKALEMQHQSTALAAMIGDKQLLQWGYDNYASIYKHVGDYKEAYAAALQSGAWKDSIYEEVKKQYGLYEANYQREQEETKNSQLREENRLKNRVIEDNRIRIKQGRLLLITVIIIAVLVFLSLFLFYKAYRTRQYNERMIEKQRSMALENQLKDSELTALRAQMNPHFIFNALSSIKNYMLEQNMELADYYLGKFAKLIRLILDNSSENFVSLEKELQLLESYIQLEQLRFENKFFYKLNIDEEINTMETFIPSMIIQPFVENAIIHGFLHKEGKCHLGIDITYHQNYLTVIIQDDGIGRLQSARIKTSAGNIAHQSKGYKISEQRLKVLSRDSYTNTGIVFKDLQDNEGNTGTRVEINIPLEQNAIV